MSNRAVGVPEAVRQKAMARGAEGQRWLDSLGYLISDLESNWGVSIGATISGGSESYVAVARTNSGDAVVVKIEMPLYESFANEVQTLAFAEGSGYVRPLDYDAGRHATLQERLGPSLEELELPVPTQIEFLCATLQRAWEVPTPTILPTGADKAR